MVPLVFSEANLLTSGCGEEKYSIYCRATRKESKAVVLKRLELPEGFLGKVYEDR